MRDFLYIGAMVLITTACLSLAAFMLGLKMGKSECEMQKRPATYNADNIRRAI